MDVVIIVLCVIVIFGMGAITAPITPKEPQEFPEWMTKKSKAHAWQERLEVARLARETHPEDFVPGSVELPDYM